MKCNVPEISWHNRDPVLSLDIHHAARPTDQFRIATGGNDSHVVIWQVALVDDGTSVEALADLTHHLKPVNVVRFAPTDEILLASADDDGHIILWRRQAQPDIMMESDDAAFREHYSISRTLRGHLQDVYDLCWSADAACLISGAVDNTAILWDVQKGVKIRIISNHDSFVQGVAWDPLNKLVATLSCDRHLRVFNVQNEKCVAKVQKMRVSCQKEDGTTEDKMCRLFHDDTLQTFCRRLAFSPDGSLLFAPAGLLEDGAAAKQHNVVHVFSRHDWTRPVFCLPSGDKHTIAVRCCPTLFKLRMRDPPDPSRPLWEQTHSLLQLPYRMIVAVASRCSILLYDTQQQLPFARVSNIHFTRLTDVSWSRDGRLLMASSTDGFCSIVTFEEGELGEVYQPDTASSDTENVPPAAASTAQPTAAATGQPTAAATAQPTVPSSQPAVPPSQPTMPLSQPTVPATQLDAPASLPDAPADRSEGMAAASEPAPTRLTPAKDARRVPLVTLSSPRRPNPTPAPAPPQTQTPASAPASSPAPAPAQAERQRSPAAEPRPDAAAPDAAEEEEDDAGHLVLHLEETTRELDEVSEAPAAPTAPPPAPSPQTPRRVPLVTLSSPRRRTPAREDR